MQKYDVICPGCGLKLISETNKIDKDFNASSACRNLMFELSYYTLSLHDNYFIHQLAVDTYAAQHSEKNGKPITITFALVGLFLFNEKNYSGREIQLVHMQLAKKNKTWPSFSVPEAETWMTVQDVTQSPENIKQEMIKKWSKSVWEIWKQEKGKIAVLLYNKSI